MDSHYLNNTQHVYDKGRVMQTEQQRAVTRLCIQCGLFLLQHGAESALVDELSSRPVSYTHLEVALLNRERLHPLQKSMVAITKAMGDE